MKLPLLLLSVLLMFQGCATWEGFNPGTQAVLKAGAKLALSFGVQELGERVKEVRPYQDKLKALIETTFAHPLPPEKLGAALKFGVEAEVPEALRGAVIEQFRKSLAGGDAPAASGAHDDYNRRVASQL